MNTSKVGAIIMSIIGLIFFMGALANGNFLAMFLIIGIFGFHLVKAFKIGE